MKFFKKWPSIFSLSFFVSGCVVNPKYSDTNRMFQDEQLKNPQMADQIRQNQENYNKRLTEQESNPKPVGYTVAQRKTSGWSAGDPNAALHIGINNYEYLHSIKLKFVCNKESLFPLPIRHLDIAWALSDTLKGKTQTGRNGEAIILAKTADSKKFERMKIYDQRSEFTVLLEGDLVIEGTPIDCESIK